MQQNLTDFDSSFFLWYSENEDTHGRFKIESICEITDKKNGQVVKYFLLNGVMAGNVYSDKDLIKVPPYYFNAIFSESEYKIFRVYGVQDHLYDTSEENSKQFTRISFSIKEHSCRLLSDIEQIVYEASSNNKLIAVIEVDNIDVYLNIRYIFPVKHINYKDTLAKFQIETGPICVLPNKINGNPLISNFNLAYVAFNRMNELHVITLSELHSSIKSANFHRFFNNIEIVKCKIKIYSY